MDKISRQEAKQAGLTRYFTGEPCKHGHIDERLVSNSVCITCSAIRKKEHPEYQQKANKKSLEAKRTWRKNDYEKILKNIVRMRKSTGITTKKKGVRTSL